MYIYFPVPGNNLGSVESSSLVAGQPEEVDVLYIFEAVERHEYHKVKERAKTWYNGSKSMDW